MSEKTLNTIPKSVLEKKKTLSELGLEWNFLYLIKGTSENLYLALYQINLK